MIPLEVRQMANISPVSDLRDYKKVLSKVSEGSPTYLTVNGRGKYVVYDIKDQEEIEKTKAMLSLMLELESGKEPGSREGYLSLEQVKEKLGLDE